jgi:hypothetical protein
MWGIYCIQSWKRFWLGSRLELKTNKNSRLVYTDFGFGVKTLLSCHFHLPLLNRVSARRLLAWDQSALLGFLYTVRLVPLHCARARSQRRNPLLSSLFVRTPHTHAHTHARTHTHTHLHTVLDCSSRAGSIAHTCSCSLWCKCREGEGVRTVVGVGLCRGRSWILGEGRIEQELIGRRAPMRLREVRMAPPVTQRVLVTGRDDWLDFR